MLVCHSHSGIIAYRPGAGGIRPYAAPASPLGSVPPYSASPDGESVNYQQDERSDDRNNPGLEIPERLQPAPKNAAADEPTNDRPDDAQQYGDDEPTGVITRHDQFCDGTCNQPKNNPAENAHARLPP